MKNPSSASFRTLIDLGQPDKILVMIPNCAIRPATQQKSGRAGRFFVFAYKNK
jgi:hypothetical protein